METRVCLCSQHHALLTPIAETLLSLLFPLVWQGAYIPVMPLAMVDILEAPVPFFVGLSRWVGGGGGGGRGEGEGAKKDEGEARFRIFN
jgi:hypothetical protein